MTMQDHKLEELLETVFTEREAGRNAAQGVLTNAGRHAGDRGEGDLTELEERGLLRRDGGAVLLTSEGEQRAGLVVRRHRLAERLFKDLLDVGEDTMESQACEFEHILSAEATDSVCTLLGHPPTCPHGKVIPPGPCCSAFPKAVRPLVTGLPSFELGAAGRIVFIAPKFHDRMDRLAALGVIPGSEIRLHQRSPSFVIEVGETTIALDPEIAREIYVKRLEA
ncbi:MAG TPA: metal-dependent transcriptional regulator [Anaeromyxobacteraceae bacterium]|jgi:DtxR family Mn-dependent transcriptional regulator|nr:metal-dependent transcriptional regulator [Anaeromyxobacteraceae bacterium]